MYVEPGRGGEGRGGGVEQPVTVYIVSGESVGWHSRDLTFCYSKKERYARGEPGSGDQHVVVVAVVVVVRRGVVLLVRTRTG